ncbi:MAG: VWA domain-containing protein [Flavobacteriaceae bacterium]|nr:VWA domain-containing protein [Flavobacteriaceae bacterium]
MSKTIIIYIVLAAVIAILLAVFQYFYNNKNRNNYILVFLRFISIFGLLLLLINPKLKKQILTISKPNLVILVDNSKSIKNSKQGEEVLNWYKNLINDDLLKNKFELKTFAFSDNLETSDSINFTKSKTGIYQSLKSAVKLFDKTISPMILITDGNQTEGYNYDALKTKQNIYPVIVGDTNTYQDLKIAQLNVNKYAYLKHKFPVEVFVLYNGNQKNIKANFVVKEGSKIIYSKNINIGVANNSKQISFYLPSNKVGIHNYKAKVSFLKNEKNKINNSANFSVEIINEKANVLLVTSVLHPDIGMLKRSIESNIQRKLTIKKPTDIISINKYQMVILYQPNQSFKFVFEKIKEFNTHFLIYTGTKTNWNFLNENQPYFKKSAVKSIENYAAIFNTGFTTYLTEDLGFNNFIPVQDYFGDVTFSVPFEPLLFQQISSFVSDNPLMAVFEQDKIRGAVFLGENSWRWRMSSFVEKKSFQPFDAFINKTIQYLASTKKTAFLEVENKKLFYANDKVKIIAYHYDANYKFNTNSKLWITITNKTTKKQLKYPFALKSNFYQVSISNLKSGDYSFSVFDENKKHHKQGSFIILPYDIEQQYIGANKKQLNQLAINTKGKAYYLNEYKNLKEILIKNKKYKPIQKSEEKVTPLIDWEWLLAIIALSLSLEWFIRKYKGLL